MELGYVRDTAAPLLESLKSDFFDSHPDDPVILHRKELVNKKPPFEVLRDIEVCRTFDDRLLQLLENLDYSVVTVVIDKQEQVRRYRTWLFDPYHYAVQVLLERYVMRLEEKEAQGDVLAESRGGAEDMRLKKSFTRVWREGTNYVRSERFQGVLTSKELKVKCKANNIVGLQLADLIAHPCFKALLAEHNGLPLPTTFGQRIAEIVRGGKYLRDGSGRIEGWGTKWLP